MSGEADNKPLAAVVRRAAVWPIVAALAFVMLALPLAVSGSVGSWTPDPDPLGAPLGSLVVATVAWLGGTVAAGLGLARHDAQSWRDYLGLAVTIAFGLSILPLFVAGLLSGLPALILLEWLQFPGVLGQLVAWIAVGLLAAGSLLFGEAFLGRESRGLRVPICAGWLPAALLALADEAITELFTMMGPPLIGASVPAAGLALWPRWREARRAAAKKTKWAPTWSGSCFSGWASPQPG